MSDDTPTDNKVENLDRGTYSQMDLAKKDGIWDSLSDEDKAKLSDKVEEDPQPGEQAEGVTPETPQPEQWQVKLSEMEQQLKEMQGKYGNLEQRYRSSSEEGKRLAQELRQYKSRDEYLRSNYDLDPLLEGYKEQPSPEREPITREDLERWSIEQEWRNAENHFFLQPDNKELGKNPVLKEMVKRWIFDDGGQYLRWPDMSPSEAFAAAATEVRNFITGERMKGMEQARTTRTELERAAIADAGGTRPEPPTQSDNKEDEVSGEDSYIQMWKENKRRHQGDL